MERRRHNRHACNLKCKLHGRSFDVSGTVIDISQSGAGIRLLSAGNNWMEGGINSVTIDEIGKVASTVRWQTGSKLGISFSENNRATDPVLAYLAEKGLTSEF
ncbi:MAG: PilZ domain-containing protein [Paracoccaceae bacterium]|nr:PilZ domain-containing protein [Paracoccaceae bacterium]